MTNTFETQLPTSTLYKVLSGRLDGMCPEIAPGICQLYENIRKAKDKTILQRYRVACDRFLPPLILEPAFMPALVRCRLTPVDLRAVNTPPFALLDGILDLVTYPNLSASDKMVMLEYVLAGDQCWRRGFEK